MHTEVRVADREGHISQHEVVVDIGRGRSRDIKWAIEKCLNSKFERNHQIGKAVTTEPQTSARAQVSLIPSDFQLFLMYSRANTAKEISATFSA